MQRQSIKALRESKNIDQRVLAQYAGVSIYYLSQLENNEAKGSNLFAIIALCDRMNLTIHELVKVWDFFPESKSNVCVVMTARKLADICRALDCDINDIDFRTRKHPSLYGATQKGD